MKTFHKPAGTIDYTNLSTAILSGAVVVMGDLVGIAMVDIAQNATGLVLVDGIVKVTKVGSQAWTQGQTVFWKPGSSYFTTVATDASRAGCAALAVGSGSGETTGYVMLNAPAGADIGTIGSHIADPASAAAMTQDTVTDSTGGVAVTTLVTMAGSDTLDIAKLGHNLASIAAQLAKIKTDIAAVRTGSEANNTAIDSVLVALENFKVVAAS